MISPSNDVIWLLLVEPLRSCIFYLLFSRRCCQCMIIKSVWWQVLGWIKSHWFPDIRPFIEYSYQRLKTYHDPTRRGKKANNQLWKSPLHCRTFLNLKAESLCEEKEIRTELFITHWNILHVKILSKRGILRLKTSLFLSLKGDYSSMHSVKIKRFHLGYTRIVTNQRRVDLLGKCSET